MNGLVLFCQLVLIYVSYSPHVRGVQPGQIYNLEVALKKIYRRTEPFDLQTTEVYERQTHNTKLRFNSGISYTILTNKKQTIDFVMKYIFIALRDIIGVIAFPSNVNVLLEFANEQDAREICVERYGLVKPSENDVKVDKVLAIDNIIRHGDFQVNEILHGGAIKISKLESKPMFTDDEDYYRFTFYPTGRGSKKPVATFATARINAQMGPTSNSLVLEIEVAGGAVYFGLQFPSEREGTKFLVALHVIDVREGIGYTRMIQEFAKKF